MLEPPEQVDPQNKHARLAIQTIGALLNVAPIAGGCEATQCMHIDPVLVAAANIVGDAVMKVERHLESAHAHGDVDCLFTNTHVPPLTICVTKGKHDQQEKGVVQNIAQLATVRDTWLREQTETSDTEPAFGTATTFLTWQCLGLCSQNHLRDHGL